MTTTKPTHRVIMAFTTANEATITVTQWSDKQTVSITHPTGKPGVYDAESGIAVPHLGQPARLDLIMHDGSYRLLHTSPVTSLIYL